MPFVLLFTTTITSHLKVLVDRQISWWIACSKVLSFTMARTLPSLFVAQKGVVTSTRDSQTSNLLSALSVAPGNPACLFGLEFSMICAAWRASKISKSLGVAV